MIKGNINNILFFFKGIKKYKKTGQIIPLQKAPIIEKQERSENSFFVILSLLKISLNKYAKKRKANAVLNESALQLIPSYKAIGKSPENRKGYLKIGVILIAIEIKIIYISKLHNLPK